MSYREAEEEKMELVEQTRNQETPVQENSSAKGGLKTLPFIIVNEAFEKVASYGIQPNLILYLMNEYHYSIATGVTILSMWSASSNFLAIFGAFLSDSYLGRFRVIALGSIASFLGIVQLWLTAMFPQMKPKPCDLSLNVCDSATPAQFLFLLSSLGLMSIGAGCIRPCSIAFGADQLPQKDDPAKNEETLQTYFNFYYATIGISTLLALTVIVYIQDHMGWKVGFAVPAMLMFLSALFFFLGNSFYIKVKASTSLFTGFAKVLVAAWRNRRLDLALAPQTVNSDEVYYYSKDLKLVAPSNNLRFLNKACIIRDPEEDLKPDGSPTKPWELCTVSQVETLKSLIRVIPIWSTGFMIYMTLSQNSIPVLQAKTMNRHITTNFEIPAGSFALFTITTLTIWVAFYDRVIVPILAKYTGKPNGISATIRMGIGLLLSCIAMAVAGIVERIRRRNSVEENFSISALWLVPQFCLIGLAEAFNAIGQIEFYYRQLPKSMSSVAVAFFTLGTAFSGLLGGLIISVVDKVTKSSDSKESWVSRNPNLGHYDYYYWFLTFLSVVNFFYFVICCWCYGPCGEEENTRASDDAAAEVNERMLENS
ncbi:hypothetical protein MKW98_021367 [Papaver atlanticum]|uniref:Uncharacterized protein n=1 Tax=Papaver atlanticum TaxID=357466 RepID=A0AAD4SR96_9MAGN|nr:hypothetical protein MKW98_021367 [Papaver atlanticum]